MASLRVGQKALVTGASGFIGRHLCRRLEQAGAAVHAISRNRQTASSHAVRWWQGDMGDAATAQHLFSAIKPDVVFHLASHVTGSRDLAIVAPTFHSNLLSTVNLLTVATGAGCRRVVLVGSLEEPEENGKDAIPCSPYAAAKWASTAYGRMFHNLYQTPVVIARVFMTYGPGVQDQRKLIPYVISSLLRGEAPKLMSGQRMIDWVYVEDVVDGLLAAAQAGNVEGCTVDLGSGILVPVRAVVEQIVSLLDTPVAPIFGAHADRPFEREQAADIDHTYAKLGWKSSTTLKDGLLRTIAWCKEHPEGLLLSTRGN
jgi:nucleoside-diphosphate-sugar epimerase